MRETEPKGPKGDTLFCDKLKQQCTEEPNIEEAHTHTQMENEMNISTIHIARSNKPHEK